MSAVLIEAAKGKPRRMVLIRGLIVTPEVGEKLLSPRYADTPTSELKQLIRYGAI